MSQTATLASSAAGGTTEHFDVVVVGAGISGVGGLYHLRTECPDLSVVAFDKFDSFGGTWHWHKYPGIRSDSRRGLCWIEVLIQHLDRPEISRLFGKSL